MRGSDVDYQVVYAWSGHRSGSKTTAQVYHEVAPSLVEGKRPGDDRCLDEPPLKGLWRAIAEGRAPPLAIVEDLTVVEERGSGLGMRGKGGLREQLALQGGKEALGHVERAIHSAR